jgi:hypothetical protein|tara:strand:+ start:1031 stop:1222 length:192 start_codon:yes stop_codon:yes gene_type:complete
MTKYKFPSPLERHIFATLLPYFQDDQRHSAYGAAAKIARLYGVKDLQSADTKGLELSGTSMYL